MTTKPAIATLKLLAQWWDTSVKMLIRDLEEAAARDQLNFLSPERNPVESMATNSGTTEIWVGYDAETHEWRQFGNANDAELWRAEGETVNGLGFRAISIVTGITVKEVQDMLPPTHEGDDNAPT